MKDQRLDFIDGLRGWGALAVYLFHLGSFFFYKSKFQFIDSYFYNTPLQIFFDGELAIFLFFLLSGFSLSYKFFKNQGDVDYVREAALYRYFRLLIPVFFAILIPYFLTKFHLMFNSKAYLGAYSTHFHFFSIFQYTFVELPFRFGANHGLYGPVFWTIYLEFIASLFIFAFLVLFGTLQLRFPLYVLLGVLFYNIPGEQGLFLFFMGLIICDLFCRSQSGTKPGQKTAMLIGLALTLCFYQYCIVAGHKFLSLNRKYVFVILLFLCTLYLPVFRTFFSSKLSRFLGRISFSLYLIHFPVLCSLSCFLFNFLMDKGHTLVFATLITGCITSLVVIVVACVFTLYIEERLLSKVKLALRQLGERTPGNAVITLHPGSTTN